MRVYTCEVILAEVLVSGRLLVLRYHVSLVFVMQLQIIVVAFRPVAVRSDHASCDLIKIASQ